MKLLFEGETIQECIEFAEQEVRAYKKNVLNSLTNEELEKVKEVLEFAIGDSGCYFTETSIKEIDNIILKINKIEKGEIL